MADVLSVNGKSIQFQGVRQVRPELDIKAAADKTKNNGLDEVFFTQNGKTYVAYGDSLNLSGLKKKQVPDVRFNGKPAMIVLHDDEINSIPEGILKGGTQGIKDVGETTIQAVRSAIGVLGTGGAVAIVGTGTAVAGVAIYKGATHSAAGVAAKAAVGSVSKGLFSGGIGVIKVIGVTAAAGAALAFGAGAVKGSIEAHNKDKDYSTIAEISVNQ